MPKKIDIDGTVRFYQRVPPLALGKAFLGIPCLWAAGEAARLHGLVRRHSTTMVTSGMPPRED